MAREAMGHFHGSKVVLSLLILLGVLVYPTVAQMEIPRFKSVLKPLCYGKEKIYGQTYPLANTLENFISLVEKLEFANTDLSLSAITFLLLRNFTINNVAFPNLGTWSPPSSNYESLIRNNLWKNLVMTPFTHTNPYNDDDTCSLHFMLSHTINDTVPANGQYPDGNTDPSRKSAVELGVVAIGRTNHVVEIGRVVMGIYLGLKTDRKRTLDDILKYNEDQRTEVEKITSLDLNVDPLYSFTLADVLTSAAWADSPEAEKGLRTIGNWIKAYDIDENICPLVYNLPTTETGKYSFASVLGSIDGVLLGNMMNDLSNAASNLRLSQILRMYYSRQGVKYPKDGKNEETLSFCSRQQSMQSIQDLGTDFNDQVDRYLLLMNQAFEGFEDEKKTTMGIYYDNAAELFKIPEALVDLCTPETFSLQKLPFETPINVIVVMDTKNSELVIEKQQEILGQLANKLDLWYVGGNVTVLLDQLNETNGRTDKTLKVLIPDTSSTTCAACHVKQYEIEEGDKIEDDDSVIQGLHNYLKQKREEQSDSNGVAGKVVVFFKFDDEDKTPNRISNVLRDFNVKNQDVTVVAVGNNQDVLKKYARGIANAVVVAAEKEAKDTVEKLAERISLVTANFQYKDCKYATAESSASYEGFVTPGHIQRWSMNPEYFLKSYTTKFQVEVFQQGLNMKVCHTRSTPRPELYEKENCKDINATSRKVEFRNTNPCKTFDVHDCTPFYFSIIGLEQTEALTSSHQYCLGTRGLSCKRLDQIPFKVSHEGIRCNGCSGVFATPSLLLVSILFVCFFLMKK